MSHQRETINKEIEILKKYQIEILESAILNNILKSTVTETKNSPEGLNSRF